MAKKNSAKATNQLSDDQIKALLEKHQDAIKALPDFKEPSTREESLALLAQVLSDAIKADGVDAGASAGMDSESMTAEESSTPSVLSVVDKSLEWTDPSNGKSAFDIEMSRTGAHFEVEATQIAGTNAYMPRDHKGTGFYRVRQVSPDGTCRAVAASNVVVIHFN